jgi:hypothetical protein
MSSTDYLRRIDTATSAVISAFTASHSMQPGWPVIVRVGQHSATLEGPANGSTVTTPVLQRHKRAFVALTKQAGGGDELSEDRIVQLFLSYLAENLR